MHRRTHTHVLGRYQNTDWHMHLHVCERSLLLEFIGPGIQGWFRAKDEKDERMDGWMDGWASGWNGQFISLALWLEAVVVCLKLCKLCEGAVGDGRRKWFCSSLHTHTYIHVSVSCILWLCAAFEDISPKKKKKKRGKWSGKYASQSVSADHRSTRVKRVLFSSCCC